MPSKSRHKGGKRPQSKKRGSRQRFSASVTQQQVVAQTDKPVSRPTVSTPSVSTPTPAVKSAAAQYPHITTELRTIGILAGIILVILTVLALVLP